MGSHGTNVHGDRVMSYKPEIVWNNVWKMVLLHLMALYGLYLGLFVVSWTTMRWFLFETLIVSLGVTAGAHRYWAHRTFSAKIPLQLFLMYLQTMSMQNDIYTWCRDHRVHHKYSETDADPHNAKRGFFFSHMGWLLEKKHPDVAKYGVNVDMTDLQNDSLVQFQRKHYVLLAISISVLIPVLHSHYILNESWITSFCFLFALRYVLSLHNTWLVNSAAHLYGYRVYDKNINPRENMVVSALAMGEGWHNYHHTFPWDYKAAELPYFFNVTTFFIDMCAKLGLSYDMKTASKGVIEKRRHRTGTSS